MQCPRCRAENREGRRFCAKCGAPFALACPACDFSNEPGEDFCGGCGKTLMLAGRPPEPRFTSPQTYTPKHLVEKILTSKSAIEGERKQVTVLFADLKGSMELLADGSPALPPQERGLFILCEWAAGAVRTSRRHSPVWTKEADGFISEISVHSD